MYEVPVLGNIARVFTFREFVIDDEDRYIEVRMPAIETQTNTQLEQRINYEIRQKVDGIIQEQEQRAKEYHQAFIETGGKEEDFHKILVNIDYHGIVAEYNPFHNGHAHLIEAARAAGATHIVAVMSGSRSCKLQCLPKSNPSRQKAGRVFYCLNSRIFPGPSSTNIRVHIRS